MPTLNPLTERHLARLDDLIEKGGSIAKTERSVPGRVVSRCLSTGETQRGPDQRVLDGTMLKEWTTECVGVLNQIIPPGHPNQSVVESFRTYTKGLPHILQNHIARLKGVRNGIEAGDYDDPWLLVRTELAGDYLAQAEYVMERDKLHVPAAVLAGAVLEDALRKLCVERGFPTQTDNGKRKTINPMNSDLKKAGVYGQSTSKEITAWAGLRNDAAHGKGDSIKFKAVERMIDGVRSFVGDYLK